MSVEFAFLDSGTGGLPYMRCLLQQKKDARCVYLADSINFPYGEKTTEQVTACASGAIDLIIREWNPGIIVIACNTISVTSLSALRLRFPAIPIVGTVPAVKLGAEMSVNRRIGLLATNATIHDPYTKELETKFASDCTIIHRGDPELVSFVEHKLFSATENERLAAVKPAVDFFKTNGCDTIILGCTHFIHLADEIAQVAGAGIRVLDSREGVIRQALKMEKTLRENKERSSRDDILDTVNSFLSKTPPTGSLYVTGFTSVTDEKEYQKLCTSLTIPWGGIICKRNK